MTAGVEPGPGPELGPAHGGDDLTRPGALAAFRDHFAATEPRLHAYVPEPERFDRLEREVAALRDGDAGSAPTAPAGPLHGVALGVKDVFRTAGLPTRAGSELPPESFAAGDGEPAEAVAVSRLRAAGAVLVGKTASTELAWFAPAPTRNPHHREHTPGGSSSGSAAAVAAGLAVLALGTQTIGSVGRPAAFCGVVGLKPTYDRIPRDGVIALAPSLDHVGVLAPDVAWARRAAAVLCDGWDAAAAEPEAAPAAPVLAVPEGPYLERCAPDALEHFRAVCRRLAGAGCEVRSVASGEVPTLARFDALERRHRRLVAAEAARVHAERYARYGTLFRPVTAQLVEDGRRVDGATLESDRARRAALRDELTTALAGAGADLWLTPGAPGPAPRGLAGTGDPALNLPWTFAGLPAVVLPCGRLDGLPLGVQLAAPFGADEPLLAVAARVERALA